MSKPSARTIALVIGSILTITGGLTVVTLTMPVNAAVPVMVVAAILAVLCGLAPLGIYDSSLLRAADYCTFCCQRRRLLHEAEGLLKEHAPPDPVEPNPLPTSGLTPELTAQLELTNPYSGRILWTPIGCFWL